MAEPRALFVGRSTFDVLYRLDHLPAEDSKVFAREFYAAPGGPALNATLTHALLGGKALLVSAVGGGRWAAAVRDGLLSRGVELLDLADGTTYETPLSTTLLNAATGSRTVVNPPASTVRLTPLAGEWSRVVRGCGALPGWRKLEARNRRSRAAADGRHLQRTLHSSRPDGNSGRRSGGGAGVVCRSGRTLRGCHARG